MAALSLSRMNSQARRLLLIFTMSLCVLAGSATRAALAASGMGLKSRGTGPPTTAPSNIVALRGQEAMRTVGMLSLHNDNVRIYARRLGLLKFTML